MPVYTFRPLPAGEPATVYPVDGGVSVGSGTADSNGVLTLTLSPGNYVARNTFGYYWREAQGSTPVSGGVESDPVATAALAGYETAAHASGTYAAKGALLVNVKDYGAVGNGVVDDTAAIQAAIDAAAAANAGLGRRVYLPAGKYQISTPLVLPRTGLTPTRVVTLHGESLWSVWLRGTTDFPAGRALIEWEAIVSRTWHQEITDIKIVLPSVAGVRAVHYVKASAGTALVDFTNERMSIVMRDVLIEGNNGYHSSLVKFEAQQFGSTFERVLGDCVPGAATPDSDYDTMLFEFETSLYGATSVTTDMTGLSYSVIKSCWGGSFRKGGRGGLVKGRMKDVAISECWCDGTRYGPGIEIVNSYNVKVSNTGNEGRSGTHILVKDSNGIVLSEIPIGSQEPVWLDWVASTAYAVGRGVVVPGWRTSGDNAAPANNRWYKCTTAGTTGATQPIWPTILANTVTDGTVVWTCMGPGVLDCYIVDGGRDVVLQNFFCDPGKPTATTRGHKVVRLLNNPVNVSATNCVVSGDPLLEVAWIDASGRGAFRSAKLDVARVLGNDPWAVPGPDATKPGFYRAPRSATITTRALTLGTEYAVPLIFPVGTVLDRLACEVSTVAAGGFIRLGVRADVGGYPGALMHDAGQFDASTLGVKEATLADLVATGHRIWVTVTAQGALGCTVRGINGPVHPVENTVASSSATTGLGSYVQTGVTGALGDFSTAPACAGSGPLIVARVKP